MTESILPEGWRLENMGQIATIVTGATPLRAVEDYFGGDIPWITSSELGKSLYVEASREHLTPAGTKYARVVPTGSVLISCTGHATTIGRTSVAGRPLTCNQQVKALVPREGVLSLYIYAACQVLRPRILQIATQSGISSIGQGVLASLQVPVPPQKEQEQIADIISSITIRIEKARALKAKLEQLRRAAAQELLARGLGHSRFKQSIIGTVPESWKIMMLRDVVDKITSGSGAKCEKAGRSALVQIKDLKSGSIHLKDRTPTTTISSRMKAGHIKQVRPGDLLISITTDLGHVSVVPPDFGEAYISKHLALVRPDAEKVDPCWLPYYFSYGTGRELLLSCATHGCIPAVALKDIAFIPVPVPPVDEQRRICSVLSDIDVRVSATASEIHKLEDLKRGLLQDLFHNK